MKSIITLITAFMALAGCAPIQTYEKLDRGTDTVFQASINDELFRIDKTRDLPNVYGKADIWGGKVNEGLTELRYMGLNEDGMIVFRLTDIDIESNENVFTRYGISSSTVNTTSRGSATVIGNSVIGSGSSTSVITHREKPDATIIQLPPNTVEFLFDPADIQLPLGNVTVDVISVTPYSITYSLREVEVNEQ